MQDKKQFDPRAWQDRAQYLATHGMYMPATETSACGVGMIVSTDGKTRRDVVLKAIEALKALWHRGAVDADGKTGDGAGIHLRIPPDFFKDHVLNSGHSEFQGRLAVGMVFLPRVELSQQERARQIIEAEVLRSDFKLYGWRQVPIDLSVVGTKADTTRPEIEQIILSDVSGKDEQACETRLYLLRCTIEKRMRAENMQDAYICSLSCRSIIYKGLFLAEQLDAFYPDLKNDSFQSDFAIYHQRYSTNTFPSWQLAQPFRVLAHNGEINTISGNMNWMRTHEERMDDPEFSDHKDVIRPVIRSNSSDSSALDAVFELLLRTRRELPEVKSMMIPEAWEGDEDLPQPIKDFYQYANGVMEPWDGPASICAYGGQWALAGLDRNGLRPLRYSLTADGLLIVGSETGMVLLDEAEIVAKGQIGPGEMLAVNLKQGKLYHDRALKNLIAGLQPFGKWVENIQDVATINEPLTPPDSKTLRQMQIACGWTREELEMILRPMANTGAEATGSMGDDTPIAVLRTTYRGMHHYFRQNFSQVTNPPIDSLRERYVMSLHTRIGNLGNILEESEKQLSIVQMQSPMLTNASLQHLEAMLGDKVSRIDCSVATNAPAGIMSEQLREICDQVEQAVRENSSVIVLSNKQISDSRWAMPMILICGAVHAHLVDMGLRSYCALLVEAIEVLETHHYAVLIGVGATAVNGPLAEFSLSEMHTRGLAGNLDQATMIGRYKQAIDKGILKIMSKMGISVISSYRGGYNFEAIGLSRALLDKYLPGMPSRISGIGIDGLEKMVRHQHAQAFESAIDSAVLPAGGFYRYRQGGDAHAWDSKAMHLLQSAVTKDAYSLYKKYVEVLREMPPIALRDLLDFDRKHVSPISLDKVSSITEIRKLLVAPGISLGALSPIAHETLSIAMNRIGAKSDSGEGGEDPARFKIRGNGDNASSAIKQVASGRFGVTAKYLNNCREIEIKMAQGAKPGEGGQLPGHKVSKIIAKLRHSTEGVELISPPPHHDIYSIEDLAQLIYDLKQINPDADVCVKLVAKAGIGTVAAGVAKAYADTILISGHCGGTGASPQSSIKYAGLPWEMGLSEAHQVLTLNGLRSRVRLRVDGGIKTGRDVVIAAILGAEEFGIGTAALVAMGCLMVRQCHSNTCPVGVCTQDEELIRKFSGTPEKVINLFSYIAEDVREILASLGFNTLQEIIGRTDLLRQISRGHEYLDDLDLNPLLVNPQGGLSKVELRGSSRNRVPDSLDAQMIKDAQDFFEDRRQMQLAYSINNTQRAIGTRMSSNITRRFPTDELNDRHISVRMRGIAGQSLGAFAIKGLFLEVVGEANDYVGKGLSGAHIVVRMPRAAKINSEQNAIIGNTCLYGATSGLLMAHGRAGERFCVRNSGAIGIVEGCGANGCEYMTGGVAVILGLPGRNFGAGMTGGMAFIYDADDLFLPRMNPEMIDAFRLQAHWQDQLHEYVQMHADKTRSKFSQALLANWQDEVTRFWHIVPKGLQEQILGDGLQSVQQAPHPRVC